MQGVAGRAPGRRAAVRCALLPRRAGRRGRARCLQDEAVGPWHRVARPPGGRRLRPAGHRGPAARHAGAAARAQGVRGPGARRGADGAVGRPHRRVLAGLELGHQPLPRRPGGARHRAGPRGAAARHALLLAVGRGLALEDPQPARAHRHAAGRRVRRQAVGVFDVGLEAVRGHAVHPRSPD